MPNNVRHQRSALRRAARVIQLYFHRRRKAILADAHSVGLDSLKGGMAALIVNSFVDNWALMGAAFVAIVVGLLLWFVGLPLNGEKKP